MPDTMPGSYLFLEQKLKMAMVGIFLGVLWSYKRHLQMSGMWTQSKCYSVLYALLVILGH